MSAGLDPVTGESPEKIPNETSLRAIQRQTQFDGIYDADPNDSDYSYRAFSRNDRSDMRRMGKIQELRVRSSSDCIEA